ncbi:hypothetical protein D3C85_803370 [compost metagenome]
MTMGQRFEGSALAFALAPVPITQEDADLFGKVIRHGAVKALGAQLGGLVGQVSQGAGWRLLQTVETCDTDHRANGDFRWREVQQIEPIAQYLTGILDAVHFVMHLGDSHAATTGTDRTTAVGAFGHEQHIDDVA